VAQLEQRIARLASELHSLGQMTPDHRMTDYYPLIARAIAGLETRESRLAAYDGVQAALLAQLHNLDPPLTDSEITRDSSKACR